VMAITQWNFIFAHVVSMRLIDGDSAPWIICLTQKACVQWATARQSDKLLPWTHVALVRLRPVQA
jgi:hypothetical protein